MQNLRKLFIYLFYTNISRAARPCAKLKLKNKMIDHRQAATKSIDDTDESSTR